MSWIGRGIRVWKNGRVLQGTVEDERGTASVTVRYSETHTGEAVIGHDGELLEPNGLPTATLRRDPTPGSFAHAILCDQPDERRWLVIDAYGPLEFVDNDDVKDWPEVYSPVHLAEWRERNARERRT